MVIGMTGVEENPYEQDNSTLIRRIRKQVGD